MHDEKSAQGKPVLRQALQDNSISRATNHRNASEHFSTGYSVKTALPCVEEAAATHQERVLSAQGQIDSFQETLHSASSS